jgi:hypothetical protein
MAHGILGGRMMYGPPLSPRRCDSGMAETGGRREEAVAAGSAGQAWGEPGRASSPPAFAEPSPGRTDGRTCIIASAGRLLHGLGVARLQHGHRILQRQAARAQ